MCVILKYFCSQYNVLEMKMLLFISSVIGFLISADFMIGEFKTGYKENHLLYIVVLVALMINSILAFIISFPKANSKNKLSCIKVKAFNNKT